MSNTDETALENLQSLQRRYSDKKQEAIEEEDEIGAAYYAGQVSALTHAIEVVSERE